jgi:hypothetical protein
LVPVAICRLKRVAADYLSAGSVPVVPVAMPPAAMVPVVMPPPPVSLHDVLLRDGVDTDSARNRRRRSAERTKRRQTADDDGRE